ncbi:hypothetical protein E4U36_006648 [Claviceps purpurea]|nr:hypothetical protein E4U36_006648 [Claviceps purpurea]
MACPAGTNHFDRPSHAAALSILRYSVLTKAAVAPQDAGWRCGGGGPAEKVLRHAGLGMQGAGLVREVQKYADDASFLLRVETFMTEGEEERLEGTRLAGKRSDS